MNIETNHIVQLIRVFMIFHVEMPPNSGNSFNTQSSKRRGRAMFPKCARYCIFSSFINDRPVNPLGYSSSPPSLPPKVERDCYSLEVIPSLRHSMFRADFMTHNILNGVSHPLSFSLIVPVSVVTLMKV